MNASATRDPYGAQAHARTMGGTLVEAMPIVPAANAAGLPPDVNPETAVWEETIASGGYASRQLARGTRLRLVDLYGDACISMLILNSEWPIERLNVADTVKVQWNAYIQAARLLLSDMGRVMMSVVEDSAGTHDIICGASNESANARRYGDGANHGVHPNARDRFRIALGKYGLGRKDIHPCVNFFKGVSIGEDGGTRPNLGPFPPGRAITLRAEMNLLVVLANCPHVLDSRAVYSVTPVRATAWRGAVTPADDLTRNGTPEALRAFLNTEDYFCR